MMTQLPSSSAANNSFKKKHAIRFHYYLALKIKSQNRTDRHSSHGTLPLLGNSHLCQEEVGDELLGSQVPVLVIQVSGDTNVVETVSAAAEERIPHGLETMGTTNLCPRRPRRHPSCHSPQMEARTPSHAPLSQTLLWTEHQPPLLTPWPLTCILKSSQLCSRVLFLNSEAPQKCTKLQRLVLQ
jgi:hypothetical protein